MKIDKVNKVNPVHPVRPIPKEHWKWTGLDIPKKQPKISDGELILYDRPGRIVVHNPSAEPEPDPPAAP